MSTWVWSGHMSRKLRGDRRAFEERMRAVRCEGEREAARRGVTLTADPAVSHYDSVLVPDQCGGGPGLPIEVETARELGYDVNRLVVGPTVAVIEWRTA